MTALGMYTRENGEVAEGIDTNDDTESVDKDLVDGVNIGDLTNISSDFVKFKSTFSSTAAVRIDSSVDFL